MTLQEQIRRNRLKSFIVLFGFVFLLLLLAGLVGFAFDLSLGVVALIGAAIYGIFALIRHRSIVAGLAVTAAKRARRKVPTEQVG